MILYILSIMNKVITIKTDEATKKAAQQLAKEAGLTLSSLINSYLKQVVITRHIEINVPEVMTPKLEKQLLEIEKERAKGQISPGYDNPDDFIKALNS